MATYKVPQDVEAEDKLLGPFTFRQFIYLLIVAGAIGLAYGLSRLFVGLAVIPLPIIIFFGALALPLRKDQPMEVYLAALVSFYLKPRKRLWQPDGVESLIEITVPKQVEVQRVKDISQEEAQQRFGYLADIVDSEGWAVRGQGVQAPSTTSMNSDAYFTAQNAPDVLDETGSVGQSLGDMISRSDARRHDEMMARMRQPATPAPATPIVQTPAVPEPSTYQVPAQPAPNTDPSVPTFNPYPTIQQTVIQPPSDDSAHQLQATPITPEPSTSEKPLSADIINLATNTDLSVEAIAREANRIKQKEEDLEDGIVLSLR
jgi:hypothetical protein